MAQLFFRAGRIALYTAGALVTLALALYFILRIPYIAQKFLLPRLAAALNIEISAENVRLDPLSSLELSGVTLSHQGSDFAEFEELTLDYNPRALFNRVFEVSSLQVKGLAFNSEYDAGVGWKNLPAYKTPDEAAPPSAWSTKVLRVRVSDSSASVKVVQHHGGAVQYIAESINLSGAFLGPNLSPSVSATAENVRTISEKREVSAKRIELLMNSDLDGWSPSEWSALLSTSEVSAALPGGNVPPSSFVFSSNGYREGDTWKLARASLEQSPGLPGEHLEVKLEGDYEIKGATGKFRAEISNADLRILNLAAIQTSKPPVIANGSARGEIAGSFDTEAERIRMFGNLEIKNLDLKPNEISGVDIRLEPQVTLAFEDSKIKWEPSDLTAFRDGSELLSSSSSGQFDFASAQGAALFEVNLLHTTLINELANQEIVPEAQISGSVNMSISEDGLRWAAQNVRGLANGQTILRGETQGTIALQEGGLQLEANIEEITDEALSRAVEAALPDFQASGQLRLNYQKPNIAAATDLKFTSLELPYTEGVDLKGSSVVKFQKSGPLIKLASAKIDFTTQEDEPVIDASAEGTINLESERKSDLLIDASFIDADKLLPQPESESQPPARNAEDHDGPMQQSPALPIAEAQIAIDKLKYRSLLLTDISGAIGSTAESVRLSFPSFKTNGWSTSLKSQAEFSGSSQYTFELGMEALEAEAFHKTVSPGLDAHVKGRMKGLEIRLQSSGRSAEDLKRHLRGEIKAQFDRLELPGELQNVIPFNIIFAPFVVVGKTAELLPLSLIPDPIERTASGISTALDESQQVVIYEGEMKLEIADSKVMVSEFVIGTDLLPAVYFSGDVAFNGEISLSSGVSLMGVKVPLPIGGTLERPYPDVTRFVAELASAIGYNITNLPQNVLNQIGSLDPTGIVGSIFPEEGQQRGQLGDMD